MSAAPDAQFLLVFTTLGSMEEARTFVRGLVDRKIVACGTIIPGATSIYGWEGAVSEATEAVVLLKTSRQRWDSLLEATQSLHPYQVPELIGVSITSGLDRYLAWIAGETIGPGREDGQ